MRIHAHDPERRALAAWLRSYPGKPGPHPHVDADRFWDVAAAAGVGPLLASVGAFSSEKAAPLVRQQAATGIRSLAVLRRVSAAFRKAQVAHVALKGPILAARLYGNYTLRPTSDVDVLIRPADFDRVTQTLETIGGHLEASYAKDLEYHRRHNHNVGFSVGGVLLELHERASTHFGAAFPSEALIERARPQDVAGEKFTILDPVDEVVFLAVHAAGHYFPRDILLLDIRLLVEQQRVDLRAVERRAKEFGVRRAVGAALVVAGARVGLELSTMSRRWRLGAQTSLRLWPEKLGTQGAADHADVVRNLIADALWSDGIAQGTRFLGERGLHHAKRIIQRR